MDQEQLHRLRGIAANLRHITGGLDRLIDSLEPRRGHQVPEATPGGHGASSGHSTPPYSVTAGAAGGGVPGPIRGHRVDRVIVDEINDAVTAACATAGVLPRHRRVATPITAASVLTNVPGPGSTATTRDVATRLGAAADPVRRRRVRHLLHAAWRLGLVIRERIASPACEYTIVTAGYNATPTQLLAVDVLATLTLRREPACAEDLSLILHEGNGQPEATAGAVFSALRYLAEHHRVTAVDTDFMLPRQWRYQAVAG